MEINQVYDNQQKPYTTNQVEQTKPSIPKSLDNYLVGYIANSMNGGHDKTIAIKPVMAGERHKEYYIDLNMQMLTPLTPAYQNLKCTLRAFFVPNSRVWENAEKFTAQKGGTLDNKITKIPSTRGKDIPIIRTNAENEPDRSTLLTNTQQWRDAWISSYIPRIYAQWEMNTNSINPKMPAMNILPIRGRVAIYNDFLRNKEFDPEIQEYKTDEVSDPEWESYMPYDRKYKLNLDYYTGRAKKENSYYSDYRTELQGFESENPLKIFTDNNDQVFLDWASWESKIAEARTQAENSQKNDWEIIAEIRGSKKLSEGKVQLIGQKTFNLNYSSVTQSSYNSSEIAKNENFQVMGTQGAYSYTNVRIPVFAGMEFIEEGFVHIIATVTADTVYESAIDRNLLNIDVLDTYRPDMLQDKKDVLYLMEFGFPNYGDTEDKPNNAVGFKRKYSELFKLPNCIAGDMTTMPLYKYIDDGDNLLYPDKYKGVEYTNSSYQFFETFGKMQLTQFGDTFPKYIWKDYTDLMINKNQAIENIVLYGNEEGSDLVIAGQNQIFFVGTHSCICDLPVDDSIKKNYTVYGEH